MQEREHYHMTIITAETTYNLWELENQQGGLDLDEMMRRMKDLSAYSLAHAEIMVQREGVELLALALFFGITSESRFQKNRERLYLLSEETFAYQGQSEKIEQQVKERRKGTPSKAKPQDLQSRIF